MKPFKIVLCITDCFEFKGAKSKGKVKVFREDKSDEGLERGQILIL